MTMGAMAASERERVPPGQGTTRAFPVLHVGPVPSIDLARFALRVDGAVARPLALSWDDVRAAGRVERIANMHCVTGWSRLDNRWAGLSLAALLERAGALPGARFVRFADERGYDTSVPLAAALAPDALLAYEHDGAPLAPEHGGPLRAVIPSLYAWKSCKWVARVELLEQDRLGFWETRGYHNGADPWREERLV